MANQIETISLVNNSIISAIDKIHPQKDDTLIFYVRTDENNNLCVPYDECDRLQKWIQNFLKQIYDYKVNVRLMPDYINLDSIQLGLNYC